CCPAALSAARPRQPRRPRDSRARGRAHASAARAGTEAARRARGRGRVPARRTGRRSRAGGTGAGRACVDDTPSSRYSASTQQMSVAPLILAAVLCGPWSGSYTLVGRAPLTFSVHGKRVDVALGAGHAGLQTVPAAVGGGRVVFRLPGAPAPLVFSGTTGRAEIHGPVRQGSAHGTFKVRRGSAPGLIAPGFYAGAGHDLAVVDDPYGPARLLDLATGEVHGLYPSGAGFVVGSGFATRA